MSVRSKMLDSRYHSDERGVCGACDEEYEPYAVLLTDDFVAITDQVCIKEHFGWLCPDCRREFASGGFAIIDDPNQKKAADGGFTSLVEVGEEGDR